jgi:hypothetical protein
MLDRFLSALIAVGLATLVWVYAHSHDRETLDNVPIPVQIVLPPDEEKHYSLETVGTGQVPVSFSGMPSRIRELRNMLRHGEIRATVVASVPPNHRDQARFTDMLHIDAARLIVPPGVTAVIADERSLVPVTMHKMVERRLPVRFDSAGDDRLHAASIEPATVLVRGPQRVLDRTRDVPTQPCPCSTIPDQTDEVDRAGLTLPLVQELEGRPITVSPGQVTVHLVPVPREQRVTVDAPVGFLCPPGFALRPVFSGEAPRLVIHLRGPSGDEPPVAYAYIDLTQGRYEVGSCRQPVRLQLPKGYQLDQEPPGLVSFDLIPVHPAVPPVKGGDAQPPGSSKGDR